MAKQVMAHTFDRIFSALVHLKIMRVFIDSVLRFGLPKESKFFMGIIKPSRNQDNAIMKKLTVISHHLLRLWLVRDVKILF